MHYWTHSLTQNMIVKTYETLISGLEDNEKKKEKK